MSIESVRVRNIPKTLGPHPQRSPLVGVRNGVSFNIRLSGNWICMNVGAKIIVKNKIRKFYPPKIPKIQ